MRLTPQQAQARVDEARACLRAAERDRDETFASWYDQHLKEVGRAHGIYAALAEVAGIPDRNEAVRQAVKRGHSAPQP